MRYAADQRSVKHPVHWYWSASRVGTDWIGRSEVWIEMQASAAVVHIPGAHRHSLDRTAVEAMALGCVLISPDIFETLGGLRPQPGVHYLLLDDKLTNLVDLVNRCLSNPLKYQQIGRQAREFVQNAIEPTKLWK